MATFSFSRLHLVKCAIKKVEFTFCIKNQPKGFLANRQLLRSDEIRNILMFEIRQKSGKTEIVFFNLTISSHELTH